MEAVLLVADVANREAGDVGDIVARHGRGTAGLAGDHDAIGRGERLAGDPNVFGIPAVLGSRAEESIHDFV